MQRQVELLRATPEEVDGAIRRGSHRSGLPEFLKFCWSRGISAMVVSDGFDRVVHAVLAAAGLPIPFFANKLEWQGGDRWRLGFPHSQPKCLVGSANCKCSHGIGRTSRKTVAIGDGRSDFCMSTRADLVIAKGTLAELLPDPRVGAPHIHGFPRGEGAPRRLAAVRRCRGGCRPLQCGLRRT